MTTEGTWCFTQDELDLLGLKPGDRLGPGVVGEPPPRMPPLNQRTDTLAAEIGAAWWPT